MLDLGLLEKLDANQKQWLLLAMAGVVIADGIIDNNELNVVGAILANMENMKSAENMMAIFRKKEVPNLQKITVKDRRLAVEMLLTATQVAIVDDNLSPKEEEYLVYVGAVLSFSKDFVQDFIYWAKQQTKVNRLRTRLIQRGITIEVFDSSFSGEFSRKLEL